MAVATRLQRLTNMVASWGLRFRRIPPRNLRETLAMSLTLGRFLCLVLVAKLKRTVRRVRMILQRRLGLYRSRACMKWRLVIRLCSRVGL